MNYDPASNDLLASTDKVHRSVQWACAIGGGIAIACIWYVTVAIRAGALFQP